MSIELVVTEAGRAALINAANTGSSAVTIAQIGVSATAVVPSVSAATLPGEIKRVSTIGGGATAEDTIHISLRDDSADAYSLRSFALYLNDGTLFAIYGQAGPIVTKTATSTAMIAIDVVLADISSAALVFGDTNFTDPNATTSTPGLLELATPAEAAAGSMPDRAISPATLAYALLGLLLARDGSGSGLDADLLDGQHGSYYADIASRLGYTPVNRAGDTMTGALGLPGDPTAAAHATRKAYVDGLTTAAALLAKLLTVDGSGSGLDADLLDGRHATAFVLDAEFTGAAVLAKLLAVDGAGSDLDADKLDGNHANAFVMASNYTAANVLGKLVTVDGSGSGLDADLLDGKHASAFANANDFATGSNARGRWWKQPDGAGGTVIEQQGRTAGRSGQGQLSILFPIPFANTDYDLQLTAVIPGFDNFDNYPQEVDGTRSVNGVTIYLQDPSSGASGTISGVNWRAKGY